jgi:hypothetical protein
MDYRANRARYEQQCLDAGVPLPIKRKPAETKAADEEEA